MILVVPMTGLKKLKMLYAHGGVGICAVVSVNFQKVSAGSTICVVVAPRKIVHQEEGILVSRGFST